MNMTSVAAPVCLLLGIGLAFALTLWQKKKAAPLKADAYLILQAVVWVLLAVLICAQAVGIYREGAARRADDPLASIYTSEAVAEKLTLLAPLFLFAVGLTAGGLLAGAKAEGTEKPARAARVRPKMNAQKQSKHQGAVRAAILAAAVAFIIVGALNGGALDVLSKAIQICSECVGLG